MHTWAEPQGYAAYVTRCTECEGEVQALTLDENGKSVILPCGHAASIKLVPNPRLVQP